jgi:hypothetical protein
VGEGGEDEDFEFETNEEEIARLMGFGGFDSTKVGVVCIVCLFPQSPYF